MAGVLAEITRDLRSADEQLLKRFDQALQVNYDLSRTLVSFQVAKSEKVSRWCKYKEGFSAELIRYILRQTELTSGRILDPFAGSGTALLEVAPEI